MSEAKAKVKARHPRALARKERINCMVPVANLDGNYQLRATSYDGYAIYASSRSDRPLGNGATEESAWLDCF